MSSADGGRTWRAGPQVSAEGEVEEVLVVPGGWLALGSVGPAADPDAAAWTSTDGRTWRPADLGGGVLPDGPGVQSVDAAAVRGDRLLLVVADVPPAGGGHRTVEVARPDLSRTGAAPAPG